MILTGREIQLQYEAGNISFSEFDPSKLSPDSYDLTLGEKLLFYTGHELDARSNNSVREVVLTKEGLQLSPGQFCLGCTRECIGSDQFVPILHGKSGVARSGLFVHVTGDLMHLGFYGAVTLQLYPTLPVVLLPGMRLAQVSFWVPQGGVTRYDGKFQGKRSP